jgi:hypothetical protein
MLARLAYWGTWVASVLEALKRVRGVGTRGSIASHALSVTH